MKKILLATTCFLVAFSIKAQIISDSVTMGANYPNEVFYQLSTQSKTTVPFADWDIGFQTTLMDASIICDDNSILVYAAPGADSTDYATLDVTGYSSWTQLYNSDTSWSFGAFNPGKSGYNFGWGIYDGTLHEVFGNSLFVVVKGSDVFKFWIRKKDSNGSYLIRFTDVTNGGADVDLTIPAASYQSKNFVYLNLNNPSTLDLEPASNDWDILFTHYLTYIPYTGYYPVTGVFSNGGVTVAKAYPVDLSTVAYTNYLNALSTNLTAIGYDWKFFDMYQLQYFIQDSLIYFIKAKDGFIYSLQFTGFNLTMGTSSFLTENLGTGINELGGALSQAFVYPNPSSDLATIVYDAKANTKVKAQLFDVSGREVMITSFEAQQGLNNEALHLPKLSPGMYQLVLNSGEQKINLKVMVAQY